MTRPQIKPSPSSAPARSALPPPRTRSNAGLKPIVLEAGPEAGHAVRQWAHVRDVLAVGVQHRQGGAAACSRRPAGTRPTRAPIRPAANWSSTTSSRSRRARCSKDHIQTSRARDGDQPRRLRQGEDQGARERAVRDPLPQRQGRQRRCAPTP